MHRGLVLCLVALLMVSAGVASAETSRIASPFSGVALVGMPETPVAVWCTKGRHR